MKCYDLASGEPCKGLDELEARAARDKVELAAVLVAAAAGMRGESAEPSYRTSEAWRALEKRLETAERCAATLGAWIPRIRDPQLALTVARGIDLFLCNVVAGYNALELAICDGLAALETGRRAMDLRYSNIGDYAREELGMNASTAAKKARLARNLRDRPLVREAVRTGEITLRKAEVIVPVAKGDQQTRWIVQAKPSTVRALKKAVNGPPDPDDEQWMTATAALPPGGGQVIREGLRWGAIVLGNVSTPAQRIESWGQEYYGAHTIPEEDEDDPLDEVELRKRCDDEREGVMEWLEQESRLWADLVTADPVQAIEFSGETDPWRIDAELKGLMQMRNRWDEVFGQVALVFRNCRAWEQFDFADFAQYCEERLGMAKRTVMQRVALERSLLRIPLLRQALREKRVTYEKARILARHWEGGRANDLIAMAERMTCVELREALAEKAQEQMCARDTFTFIAPPHVFDLLKDVLRSLRSLGKRAVLLGECLVEIAAHYVAVWKAHVRERMTKRQRILARDRHRCQVPGCSRPAAHVHHLEFRSHGGSDDESNLLSVCAAHHLFGIHEERMRVTGQAPGALVWEFGLRRSWAATAAP